MIVLDCSAAIEIAEQTNAGLALASLLICDEEIVSVDLLPAEATSVIRKQVLRQDLSRQFAARYLSEAIALVDRFIPAKDMMQEVLSESLRLEHSSYDMYYFVLARRSGATLFTTDNKLVKLCEENGVNVITGTEI